MTWQRWCASTACFLVALGAFWYAVQAIQSSVGMVILLAMLVAGGAWVVNTVDLLCGRWLRRGPPAVVPRGRARPGRIRRIIVEEIEDDSYGQR